MQNKRLQVAAPQAGMNQVCGLRHERRNFRAVLAGTEFRQLVHGRLGIRVQIGHGQHEVLARILTPGVILVDHAVSADRDFA